jgi:cell filamentation protein, protein adenylyltransferase
LIDLLFEKPYIHASLICNNLNVQRPTANTLISRFIKNDILREITGQSYGRIYLFEPYMTLLREGTEPLS